MLTLDMWLAFGTATAIFAFMPGPALIYCAAQTVARGRAGGLMAAFGVHLGGYVHVAAAAFGLSAVFQHVPTLYFIVKLVGAAYLIWLGISIIRTRLDGDLPSARTSSTRRAFIHSMSVEILNPKAALFFIAFLPQFVDPAGSLPVGIQMLILGVIVNLAFGLADVLAVLFASILLAGARRTGFAQRAMRWIGGTALIGLGGRLALDRT